MYDKIESLWNIIKLYYLDDLTGLQASPAQPYRHTLRPFGLRDEMDHLTLENAVGRDTVCEKLIFPNFFFQGHIIPISHIHQISGIDQITWRHIIIRLAWSSLSDYLIISFFSCKDYLSYGKKAEIYQPRLSVKKTSRLSRDTAERKIIRRMNEYKGFLRIRNLPIKSI
ncbi:unnamed protein product [Rhizophagus irregularis]|nr:unnamed protein product [Rhizophagus irregularis]CAB5346172.1 unnamed protein product [Rhizophagus irregularis]